jgi:hypothetical protein
MEILLWIISGASLILAIIALYMVVALLLALREKSEEIKHLTTRVDGLMECVREFNKRLNAHGIR